MFKNRFCMILVMTFCTLPVICGQEDKQGQKRAAWQMLAQHQEMQVARKKVAREQAAQEYVVPAKIAGTMPAPGVYVFNEPGSRTNLMRIPGPAQYVRPAVVLAPEEETALDGLLALAYLRCQEKLDVSGASGQ